MTSAELYERAKYFFPPPPAAWVGFDSLDALPHTAGVYFIWEGTSVVYVGETIDLKARLRFHEHASSCRSISFIECDKRQRRRLEAFYIGVLDPHLNKESTRRCQVAFAIPSGRTSLVRRVFEYVAKNDPCSLSDIYRSAGRKSKSRHVRDVLSRLVEWRLVSESIAETAGRPKRVYSVADKAAVN